MPPRADSAIWGDRVGKREWGTPGTGAQQLDRQSVSAALTLQVAEARATGAQLVSPMERNANVSR